MKMGLKNPTFLKGLGRGMQINLALLLNLAIATSGKHHFKAEPDFFSGGRWLNTYMWCPLRTWN